MTRSWWRCFVTWLGAAGVVVVPIALVYRDAPAHWLVLDDPLPAAADAVLVMAGDPGYERTTTAARLVTEGRARLLVLTGGERGPGDSAASLKAWALHLGVPPDRIRMEEKSSGTRSSMLAVKPVLERERVRVLVLVTSPYHQRRAYAAAAKAFGAEIRILNHPARPSFWSPSGWWRTGFSRGVVLTEYAKLAYYAARRWI